MGDQVKQKIYVCSYTSPYLADTKQLEQLDPNGHSNGCIRYSKDIRYGRIKLVSIASCAQPGSVQGKVPWPPSSCTQSQHLLLLCTCGHPRWKTPCSEPVELHDVQPWGGAGGRGLPKTYWALRVTARNGDAAFRMCCLQQGAKECYPSMENNSF